MSRIGRFVREASDRAPSQVPNHAMPAVSGSTRRPTSPPGLPPRSARWAWAGPLTANMAKAHSRGQRAGRSFIETAGSVPAPSNRARASRFRKPSQMIPRSPTPAGGPGPSNAPAACNARTRPTASARPALARHKPPRRREIQPRAAAISARQPPKSRADPRRGRSTGHVAPSERPDRRRSRGERPLRPRPCDRGSLETAPTSQAAREPQQ